MRQTTIEALGSLDLSQENLVRVDIHLVYHLQPNSTHAFVLNKRNTVRRELIVVFGKLVELPAGAKAEVAHIYHTEWR